MRLDAVVGMTAIGAAGAGGFIGMKRAAESDHSNEIERGQIAGICIATALIGVPMLSALISDGGRLSHLAVPIGVLSFTALVGAAAGAVLAEQYP